MQVYPKQSGDDTITGLQPPPVSYQPPPPVSYQAPPAPPPYQTPPVGYFFGQQATAASTYNNFTPPGYGYGIPLQPQQPIPSDQNVQLHLVNVGAPQPVIITQQTVLTPPSYLGWSIFTFLCCFWPLGLAAIIFSCKVGSARSSEEARRNSMTARNLNIAATVIAPVLAAVFVGCVAGTSARVTASSGYSPSSYYYYYYSPSSYYYSQSSYNYTSPSSYYYSYLTSYSYFSTYSYSIYRYAYSSYYGRTYTYSTTSYAYAYLTGYTYTQGVSYYSG